MYAVRVIDIYFSTESLKGRNSSTGFVTRNTQDGSVAINWSYRQTQIIAEIFTFKFDFFTLGGVLEGWNYRCKTGNIKAKTVKKTKKVEHIRLNVAC